MTKSKTKGNVYERDFCKRLSRWWTGGKRDDIFYKTSNSGGRASMRDKKGHETFNQYGDVCAVDPVGMPLMKAVTIELKRGYNDSTVHNLLDRKDHHAEQQFEEWVGQASTDTKRAGVISWLLVTRRDTREEIIWMRYLFWRSITYEIRKNPKSCKPCPFLRLEAEWGPKRNREYVDVCGMLLQDWFRYIKPQYIEDLVEEQGS